MLQYRNEEVCSVRTSLMLVPPLGGCRQVGDVDLTQGQAPGGTGVRPHDMIISSWTMALAVGSIMIGLFRSLSKTVATTIAAIPTG